MHIILEHQTVVLELESVPWKS